jgi:hypothetical protein
MQARHTFELRQLHTILASLKSCYVKVAKDPTKMHEQKMKYFPL